MRMVSTVNLALILAAACLVPAAITTHAHDEHFGHEPKRIVSAYGVVTHYVYALGAGDRLVAGTFVTPASADGSIERMHQRLDADFDRKFLPPRPDAETVIALSPDLVLTNPARNPGLAEVLEDLSIGVLQLAPESIASIRSSLVLLGAKLGGEAPQRAALLDAFFEDILSEVATAAARAQGRPRVLFMGAQLHRVPAGDMLQNEMVYLAGGASVSTEIPGHGWRTASLEDVILWDPEVIVIAPYGDVVPEDLLADALLSGVTAVRDGRVVKMPRLLAPWDTPGPESVLGILWLTHILHPDSTTLDVRDTVVRFYESFYDITLDEADLEVLRRP